MVDLAMQQDHQVLCQSQTADEVVMAAGASVLLLVELERSTSEGFFCYIAIEGVVCPRKKAIHTPPPLPPPPLASYQKMKEK